MRPIGLPAAQRHTSPAAMIDWSESPRCSRWCPIGAGCWTVRSRKKSCRTYENTVAPVIRLEAPRLWIVWNRPPVASSAPRNPAVRLNCVNDHNRFVSPELAGIGSLSRLFQRRFFLSSTWVADPLSSQRTRDFNGEIRNHLGNAHSQRLLFKAVQMSFIHFFFCSPRMCALCVYPVAR